MRIALDATYSVDLQPSGIGIYSRELLSGLARNFPDDEFLHCYRVKQLSHAPKGGFPNVQRRLLLPPLKTFGARLFHALNQRVDRRPAKTVISTFHDLFVMTGDYSSRSFRVRFKEQARRAARNSDFIIAVSQFTANQVSSLLDFDGARIRVVPHGVQQCSLATGPEREKMILFVGALQTRKNILRLVEAFESQPKEWRLVLAGAPAGYQAANILERIERSACRERIQVTGYVSREELDKLYACAAIFAFPSLDEGFGIPVLEAMAQGVPVITSNRSALAEVAAAAAILIDPEQTDELRSALERLIQDEDLRARLIEQGRSRAREYTWDRAVRSTYAVYKEAVK